MTEHIELQYLHKNQRNQSDSEEYHEISHEALQGSLSPPRRIDRSVNEYDFFTQYDTGTLPKQLNKKKRRKRNRRNSVMDAISSELADKPLLIENKIVIMDSIDSESYLERTFRPHQMLKSAISRNVDAENGLNECQIDFISPVFPRILENNVRQEMSIPVQYSEPSLFSDIITEYLESGTKQTTTFLDIVLRNIHFKHHYEFSLEKLLSVKLNEYYIKYEATKKNIRDIVKKIDVNRRIRHNLKEKLLKISLSKKDDPRCDINVLRYTNTMLDLKETYFQSLQVQKDNIHQIVSLWADIEMIREKSGHLETDCLVQINHNEIDQNEFDKQWNDVFETEYSDMIIKIEYDYVTKYLEYKERKQCQGDNDIEGSKVRKPKLEIDYDKLKIQVESLVNSIVLKNNIDLYLKKERSKRKKANNRRKSFTNRYNFKIYVDDVFVCESDYYIVMEDQDDVDFVEYLSIEILSHNKYVNIIVFENDEEVSSFKVKLSDIKKNTYEIDLKHTFVFNKIVEPSVKYAGSGYGIKEIAAKNKVRLKSSNLFKGKIWARCDTNIQLIWNNKLNNNKQFETVKLYASIRRQLKQYLLGKCKPTLNEITEMINNLYNNNIESNQSVMTALTDICKTGIIINNDYNLGEHYFELTRFKLLHLRSRGGFLDIENKAVPLFSSQISTDLLGCLQRNEKQSHEYLNFKGDTENNCIDVQRFIGMKFIKKLNSNLMKKINDLLLKTTYKDVVRDFEYISFRSLLSNQTNILLSAASGMAKQRLIKDSLLKEQEIHITVFRAFNLTDRSSTITDDENDCEDVAGFKVHPLRPFVQVSYHGVVTQTTTAVGRHPTWNHALKIKTRLDPLSSIRINIYDQCKENINGTYPDDQSTNSTVIYRKYNKWLGSINVPIYTVLSLGNVRGTFKLGAPPLIFGYENISTKPESTLFEVNQVMRKASFVALQITTSMSHLGGFQTHQQPISNDAENDYIIRHINEFVTEYTNRFPTRNISLTFIDSSGRNRCVSEFLQAIPTPGAECFPTDPGKSESALSKSSGLSKSSSSTSSRKKMTKDKLSVGVVVVKSEENNLEKSIEAIVRYVSLIPTYEVTETHVVTLMGVELLKVLYGSPLDHTILLLSYFLYMEIKCWIVIGFALPRGLTSFVLVEQYQNRILRSNEHIKRGGICGGAGGSVWYIYDAITGERYDMREIGCPLKTVNYAFDAENIWVNIRTTLDCESVSFNFSNSSDWQVVLNKSLFMTKSINDSLYSKPEDVEGLRLNLEVKIKNKIQKWRSHVKTIWNRYCGGLLRDMLPRWEYWSFNSLEPRPSPGHRFKQFMATYKVYGFPINVPYLNSKQVISTVKSTSVHVNDNPNVEFGLAVEVYAYPNNVLSVWVFLAAITRI